MHSPFIDISVDNVDVLHQSVFEFIDIPKQCPIDSLLHYTANIVEWTVIKAVRGYIYVVMKFT